ncbi:hypothetical protein [Caballeronia calidae]|uniref:hypothetical protein n=1 Tax=Caballeronia calidae TaxID=1777139 RepID=UPI0009408D54|nr:hypothetical protein [Caballeronia calidae]
MINKRISVSYRVSPRFKALLERAADRENRSQTNLLETLLFDFCRAKKIEIDPERPDTVNS